MKAIGQTVMGLGAALSGLGAVLEELGADDSVVKGFNAASIVLTSFGGVVSLVSSLAPVLGASFSTAGVTVAGAGVVA